MTKKELNGKFEELKKEYLEMALADAKKKFVPGIKFNCTATTTNGNKFLAHAIVVDVNSIELNDDKVVANCDCDWFYDKSHLKGGKSTEVKITKETIDITVLKLYQNTLSEPSIGYTKITNSEYEKELAASEEAVLANAERLEKKKLKEERAKESEANALKYRRQTCEVEDNWGNKIHIGDTVLYGDRHSCLYETVVKDMTQKMVVLAAYDRKVYPYQLYKIKSREDEFTGIADADLEKPLTGKEWALQRADELFKMAPDANVIVLATRCYYELTDSISKYEWYNEEDLNTFGYNSVNSSLWDDDKISQDEFDAIQKDIEKICQELGYEYGDTEYTSSEADYAHNTHISFIVLEKGKDEAIETKEI